MPRMRRFLTAVVAATALATVGGCQGAFDLPLPGGAAQSGDVIHVTAEFADVLDLVPQSAVKVDQVTVGAVEKIELNGWTARVTLRLPKGVPLPDNAVTASS
jgi:phospholipid/cholesterol/gamma-HCH transport system substrate-binding protein